ncbi:MAG TPA: hypothetical protein DD638_04290 [Pasteurellaceae bacterium]|nr:hypothetical protein [Pasteurellaceae bacterium]
MMNIIDTNARATIQDLGRFGFRSQGIGHAGAMDGLALQTGNLLLGNPANTAAVEIPLGSLTLFFEQDTPFCITGAFYEAYLDEEPIYSYWRYTAKAGQIVRLVRARIGMYGYLCVQGGFSITPVLGSCSTDIRAQFGGFEGRCLRQGDCIPTAGNGKTMSVIGIAPIPLRNTLYAVPSSEYQFFNRRAQFRLRQNRWLLQSNSDRMGYRFNGEPLELKKPLEMLSHAIQFGTIQVPPDGQPIILMADAQTTGGYPKIACIVAADLGRLSQIRLGSRVQFRLITMEQAQLLYKQNLTYLNQIQRIAHVTS